MNFKKNQRRLLMANAKLTEINKAIIDPLLKKAIEGKRYVRTNKLSREEWLVLRQKVVGGSDISAITGSNRYKSVVDLFIDKTAPTPIDIEDNLRLFLGREVEPIVAKLYEMESGNTVVNDYKMRLHQDYDFIGANVDRVIQSGEGPGILECKTADPFAVKNWTDEVPLMYYEQLQWYLGIFGYEWGAIAVLEGFNDFNYHSYPFDKDYFEFMVNEAVKFWVNHVETGIAPEPRDGDDVVKLYKRSKPKALEADDDLVNKINVLSSFKKDIKKLEETATEIEDEIKKEMKDCDSVKDVDGNVILTWKSSEKRIVDFSKLRKQAPMQLLKYAKSVDLKNFCKQQPLLAKDVISTVPQRRLAIKKSKSKK